MIRMAGKRSAEATVLVAGFKQEFCFADGISAREAVDHIGDVVDVKSDLLVLERRAGSRTAVLGANSMLAPAIEYTVRLRKESIPTRRFGAGMAVDPNSYYYVPPNIDGLVSDLLQGKYCVLRGPRQSGKTTMVMAARRELLLLNAPTVVYLDGILGVRESWSGHELWSYLHECLHLKCPSLFPARNKQDNDVSFRTLFLKNKLSAPVIVVLDEADTLLHLSSEVISEFFAAIRSLKNDRGDDGTSPYNLFAFMLVGVETVLDLLEAHYDKRVQDCLGRGRAYEPGRSPSRLSPFPHDHVLLAERFTYEEVEALLQEAANDRPKVALEVQAISKSIFGYTAGHKGLTGTCLAYVIQEQLWTFKAWLNRVESYLLGAYVFGMETYSRILSFMRSQESIPEAREVLLEFLGVKSVECDAAKVLRLRDFIANGVLAATPINGESSNVGFATPLLRTAILRRCTITCDQVDSPPCATRLDRTWLILESIKTLDGETMTRLECQKARGAGASEYMRQFLFLCRIKAVLQHAYPTIGAKVLFEVKEELVEGESRVSQLRCDSLIRDGDGFCKFALEFTANATLKQIYEHMVRALLSHEQHSAEVIVMNFCMNKSAEDELLVTPSHDSLVFASVNFTPDNNSARVKFINSVGTQECYEVPLRNWNGNIVFKNLC